MVRRRTTCFQSRDRRRTNSPWELHADACHDGGARIRRNLRIGTCPSCSSCLNVPRTRSKLGRDFRNGPNTEATASRKVMKTYLKPLRTHFRTDFEARSSEKFVGKAGGRKGSEVPRGSRTVFADNAVPRALQPITAERSFEMGSSIQWGKMCTMT